MKTPTHVPRTVQKDLCDHRFVYQGVVTWPTEWALPGSGAHGRIYADAYHCEKCLELKLSNEREFGNTYSKPVSGAVQYAEKPK